MIGELRTGRKLTMDQQLEIAAVEDRLKVELLNSTSLERSYASAVREIESLRKALDFAQQAIDSQKETIKEVKEQRDEARQAAKTANKRALLSVVVPVAIIIAKVFGVF